MTDYIIVYPNELSHHGVKGMKWGVRKEYEYQLGRVRNIGKYGWRQGHGKNVYSRIQNVKRDSRRMGVMSKRQKMSLASAEKYWKNRASGKGIKASGNRNIIKRATDSYRSNSFNRRLARSILTSAPAPSSRDPRPYGVRLASSIAGTPMAMLGEEIIYNKIFGHF